MYPDLEELHHCAVTLHLHLYSFFNRQPRLERREDLVQLYWAATAYLDRVFKLQRDGQSIHAPYHILQLALAAGFALLKLLNSDFAGRLPSEGRQYVLQTVEVLRKAKVETNDLVDRFAEVLAQLWKESSRGRSLHSMSQSPVISNPGVANMFNSNVQAPQPSGQRRDSSGESCNSFVPQIPRDDKMWANISFRLARRPAWSYHPEPHEYERRLRLRMALA